MGYLNDTIEELRAMLASLEEDEQEEIVQFVSKKVLESYRNGQEQGQATKKLAGLSKGLEKAGKRYFGKRKSND